MFGQTDSQVSTLPARPSHAELLEARRPRSLPIAPEAPAGRRNLPLTATPTKVDEVRPIYCVWEITLACDLACRHCGSRAGKARPEELSTDEALELAKQLIDLGVKEVTLIGGEAYLRDDWLQIIETFSRANVIVSTTTGGRGFTAERARAAAQAGLRAASVSLDGMREVHDRLRGVNGSFDAALAAMANLKSAGLPVYNNTQINRLSLPELPELLETIIANGSSAWQFMLTVPMGRAVDEPEVLLQPYDLLEVFPLLVELKKRADETNLRMWRGNTLGYFGPYESLFRSWTPNKHGSSCGAGRSTIGIEADGTIKGCPSLGTKKWAAGNSRDAKLVDIWTRGEPIRYTRTRTQADLWGYCATCYYADTCRAGCTWMSDMLLGKPGNNPYCHHRALEMNAAGKRERVVQIEKAPGVPFDHGLFELIEEPLEERL
jgi:radical SAM protein with 4Fe4S-binding SPASM domain